MQLIGFKEFSGRYFEQPQVAAAIFDTTISGARRSGERWSWTAAGSGDKGTISVHGVVAWRLEQERRSSTQVRVPMHTAPVKARRGCPPAGQRPMALNASPRPACAVRAGFPQRWRVACRFSRVRVAMRVVAEIDLAEASVDAIGRRVKALQYRSLSAGGVALRRTGCVERPRPGDRAPAQRGAAFCKATA